MLTTTSPPRAPLSLAVGLFAPSFSTHPHPLPRHPRLRDSGNSSPRPPPPLPRGRISSLLSSCSSERSGSEGVAQGARAQRRRRPVSGGLQICDEAAHLSARRWRSGSRVPRCYGTHISHN
ncbi:unnamed protein product [Urochloa humidicola]